MIDATTFFNIILSLLGSVLLVALIILVVKLINVVNRVNNVLDKVDEEVDKFNRIFKVADIITDNMAMISDKVVDGISDFIRNIFNKGKRKEEEINE